MEDSALIDRFLQGDDAAFNTLVSRWQSRLFHFALRYVGQREEARDLCQQTFIRVYHNLGKLEQKNSFGTWLHQIAINICRDHLRQRRATLSLDRFAEEHGHFPPQLCENESAARDCELRDLLNRALQTLPEEQRVVVVLKEYQGLKFTEIASALDENINTVKSRLYYGLKALRTLLAQWDIDPVEYL